MSSKPIPPKVQRFWADFLAATGRPAATPLYDAGPFGDRSDSADLLVDLVVRGEKTATTSLLREYEIDQKRPPRPGDLSVVTDGGGRPICVVETTAVEVLPFDQVGSEFAAAEGEGDRSLRFWRRTHRAFFERLCAELGETFEATSPVVCERFRVLHPSSPVRAERPPPSSDTPDD